MEMAVHMQLRSSKVFTIKYDALIQQQDAHSAAILRDFDNHKPIDGSRAGRCTKKKLLCTAAWEDLVGGQALPWSLWHLGHMALLVPRYLHAIVPTLHIPTIMRRAGLEALVVQQHFGGQAGIQAYVLRCAQDPGWDAACRHIATLCLCGVIHAWGWAPSADAVQWLEAEATNDASPCRPWAFLALMRGPRAVVLRAARTMPAHLLTRTDLVFHFCSTVLSDDGPLELAYVLHGALEHTVATEQFGLFCQLLRCAVVSSSAVFGDEKVNHPTVTPYGPLPPLPSAAIAYIIGIQTKYASVCPGVFYELTSFLLNLVRWHRVQAPDLLVVFRHLSSAWLSDVAVPGTTNLLPYMIEVRDSRLQTKALHSLLQDLGPVLDSDVLHRIQVMFWLEADIIIQCQRHFECMARLSCCRLAWMAACAS
jgi:hypothetical protein